MSQVEAQWLDNYHWTVRMSLAGSLEPDVAAWLLRQTLPNNMQFLAE
ncbi:M24 family metallopeptidase C-terminal domain-containing protein [Pseudomonas umsongensis]